MARARGIKPGIMDNEELAECDFSARLLFVYLWMLADREGRLEDRPKRIRVQAFPYDSDVDVDNLLQQLHDRKFILRYSVGDGQYIQVLKFSEHQTPHCKEKASTIPAPDKVGANPVQAPDKVGAEKVLGECKGGAVHPPSTPVSVSVSVSQIDDSVSGGASKPAPSARGTRLPADWKIPDEYKTEAKRIRPDWHDQHVQRIADGFRDYWVAKTGQGATKADWLATWRNWCRNDRSQVYPAPSGGVPPAAPTRASHKPMPTLPPRKPRPEGIDLG